MLSEAPPCASIFIFDEKGSGWVRSSELARSLAKRVTRCPGLQAIAFIPY